MNERSSQESAELRRREPKEAGGTARKTVAFIRFSRVTGVILYISEAIFVLTNKGLCDTIILIFCFFLAPGCFVVRTGKI